SRNSGVHSQVRKLSMKTLLIGTLIVLGCAVGAQTPDAESGIQTLQRRLDAQRHLLIDWAGLTRYGSDDAEIRPPAPGENRVVFLGDEITELWGRGGAKFFPGKSYINRGITGQTTPQML